LQASMRTFRLTRIASEFASAPAIIISNKIIDYSNCLGLVHSVAQNLTKMGFEAGDRIGILSANSVGAVLLLLASLEIRAVAVLLNTRLPASQLLNALHEVDCHTVYYSHDKFDPRQLIGISCHNIREIVGSKPANNRIDPEAEISFDQDATIVFTSGSTSTPKAVLHTFRDHYFSAVGSNRNIPFGSGDKWLLSLPLYHVGGLAIIFRSLVNGGSVIIPGDEMTLSESIARFQPTHVSLVATQLYRLRKENDAVNGLRKMKAILLGGSATPRNLIREAIHHRLPICTSYGSTEMASQITTTKPGDDPERLFTSGRMLDHRQLKISNDGEILVKGDTLFRGYVNGNGVLLPLDSDGWFDTGDLGTLDGEGYLTVTGRKDNMFISGGENIQPEEIENALGEIEGVTETIVVSVENDEYGKRPVAFVEMEGGFPGEAFFRECLRGKIARFKIPDRFFPIPDVLSKAGIKSERSLLTRKAEALVADDN
jgi:o-succinylbenzoate---CoA ligase